jgi:GNAT superfamily N-acetyltransferase
VTAVRAASSADDVDACVDVVLGLPAFFTPDVAATVRDDLRHHGGYVVADGTDVLGFAVVDRRFTGSAEILWIAVRAVHRGRGLGTRLLDHVLAALAAEGVRLVLAKTLDRSAGHEPYASTLAFWERSGFVQVATILPPPGWQPGNPAALYVAAPVPTR